MTTAKTTRRAFLGLGLTAFGSACGPTPIPSARFRGTGAAVLLQDEFKWGTNRNYYDVVIDDSTVVKLATEKTTTRYEVVTDLPDIEHTLTLVKRTEAGK